MESGKCTTATPGITDNFVFYGNNHTPMAITGKLYNKAENKLLYCEVCTCVSEASIMSESKQQKQST